VSVKVRKRNGTWWVFICYSGRRKAKKVGTREAAERVKREIEARLALGDFGVLEQKKETTFIEYGKKWLELHAKANCKTSTYERYEQVFRIHLSPRFCNCPIDRIERDDLKRCFSELVISKRHGLGTLRNIVATLRAILSEAVEDGIIEGNPASRLGKYTFGNARKRDIDFLKRSEAAGFLTAARTHSPIRYPLFLTALRTGLRLGELIALHWEDIQFGDNADDPNRFILVRRNYSRGEFTTPKNHKTRRVDMSRELRRVLLDLRDEMAVKAFEKGEEFVPRLVFPSTTGGPLDGINVYHRDFLPCVEAAGLRHITFHALRHSYASHLIQAGASLAYVKDQMGHSSIQVTVDTYGHLVPGADIAWADKLDAPVTSQQLSATQTQPEESQRDTESSQLLEKIGGPARIRTWDQRIMSPLL
jgi:integrase